MVIVMVMVIVMSIGAKRNSKTDPRIETSNLFHLFEKLP